MDNDDVREGSLGRRAFVEEVFIRSRPKMGVTRKVGARKPKGTNLGEWRTLVDGAEAMAGELFRSGHIGRMSGRRMSD